MNRLPNVAIRSLVFCGVAVIGVGSASSQVILKEDFEAGVADQTVPTSAPPWRVNDAGFPVAYRTTDDPFSSGSQYGYLNDNVSAAPGNGIRFMSTDALDTDQIAGLIGGQVTTLSFEFWEPLTDNATLGQPGLGFGYNGSGIDLNAAGRNYRAFLRDGMLNPDALANGAAVAYTREVAQTIYMLCNDTANPVENYRDGRTLAANQADVWIQEADGDPVYAFSVNNQHVGTPNRGIGFRTFTLDTEEFYLNDVLLLTGTSFDRSAFESGALLGDFNGDDVVDGLDLGAWKIGFGTASGASTASGDADGDGDVDGGDFLVWQQHVGASQPVGIAAAAVPEPSVVAILLPILLLCGKRRIAS